MWFRWNWRVIVTEQKRAARSPDQVWVITKNGDSTDLNVTETESGTETDIGETKVAQICAVIWKDLLKLIICHSVCILHVPLLSIIGLNIILNNLPLVISYFRFIDSFSTHILMAYFIVQYNFNLAFFDTNLLLNIFLLTY